MINKIDVEKLVKRLKAELPQGEVACTAGMLLQMDTISALENLSEANRELVQALLVHKLQPNVILNHYGLRPIDMNKI